MAQRKVNASFGPRQINAEKGKPVMPGPGVPLEERGKSGAGGAGRGVSFNTKLRHEIRTDGYSAAFEREAFKEICEQRRHVPVKGCLGGIILTTDRFSLEEVEFYAGMGLNVPLDLVPRDYWWISVEGHGGILAFGEEMLGSDF